MEIVYSTGPEQEHALNAIIGERAYQDAKLGTVDERPKQVGSWLTLMRVMLRNAEEDWATSDNDQDALASMRKAVAVGVACFEQHGVPMRDVPVIESPPVWSPARDPRLASISNERLHKGYDALRGTTPAPGFGYDFKMDDCETLTLTSQQIDTELEARGDGPIPF